MNLEIVQQSWLDYYWKSFLYVNIELKLIVMILGFDYSAFHFNYAI